MFIRAACDYLPKDHFDILFVIFLYDILVRLIILVSVNFNIKHIFYYLIVFLFEISWEEYI